MSGVGVLVGLALVFLGRQLYWLFVAAAGFVLGFELAGRYFTEQPAWVIVLIALAAGVVGALLALVAQALAVGAAGFIIGAFALNGLLQALGVETAGYETIILVIGGVVGVALVVFLFDLALIVLSSLAGSSLVAQAGLVGPPLATVLFFVLLVLGIIVQYGLLQRGAPERPGRRWRARRVDANG